MPGLTDTISHFDALLQDIPGDFRIHRPERYDGIVLTFTPFPEEGPLAETISVRISALALMQANQPEMIVLHHVRHMIHQSLEV